MRVLLWHVHGSYTTSFVQGGHEYVIPVIPDRGPDGRGLARTYPWPSSVREASPRQLRDLDVDVVVLQRPHELELAERWLGRRPGQDVPAIFLEHNTPKGDVPNSRHPVADRPGLTIVHVTHFNRLFWDTGSSPTRVVEHGIVDPGYRFTGELPRIAVAVNEPVRRGRVTGTDLLAPFAAAAPVDAFGIGAAALPAHTGLPADRLGTFDDVTQRRMHIEFARRRVYAHLPRWTSLGLSLLEAMHLGMPVVALATTEAYEAVPPGAGILSTDPGVLVDAARRFIADPDLARAHGEKARQAALDRYGLDRFLSDWDEVLTSAAA
ncbi:glycosyltransferase [Pseudofrankia asymbiotica]|uniref:Glycosyl transferase n=1 Tax=Pseudofrankia asymbiotica TaxID=1834516 RepID=A0A1V2I1H0_9ACTN|nr:glycosyltransferase [Pseudofrankia asymbiotica]ONH23655.1 glycosyl transferase [Pseudofrankia asymbiotica]